PVRINCARNIRRVFSRHPSRTVGVDGRGGVITPACNPVSAERGISSKTVLRLIACAGDLNSANARVIERDKSGARVIIRSTQCEDNAPLLLGIYGNGRIEKVRSRPGNNSLCDQAGREKCAVNLRIEGEIFGYEPPYTLCVEHLRTKCRPQST